MEEYFGAFFGSLRSLELMFPKGDHKDILYFVCQFRDLRDLKINIPMAHPYSAHNGAPHFDIKSSPPLDGTLDLRWNVGPESDPMGAHFIPSDLAALPSGVKFRTLKFSGYTGDNLQLLIDACASTLECLVITGASSGVLFPHGEEHLLFTSVRPI